MLQDHVYHLRDWMGQGESFFHPTTEMRCSFLRDYLQAIAPVLNYLAKRFAGKFPKLHARCVDAAKRHGIPTTTPGYPHQMVVLNVMRTKTPPVSEARTTPSLQNPLHTVLYAAADSSNLLRHNDIKDDKNHMSIDLPFGNWRSGGELQLHNTKYPAGTHLNRFMALKSGEIGVGNFKRVTHHVGPIVGGVRCSLLLICHATYFSTSHPFKPQVGQQKTCTATTRCPMCTFERQKLTKPGLVDEITKWANSL